MKTYDYNPEYKNLYEGILDEIAANGLKSTTMDSVAAHFGMSKRTLYEIFRSKEEMITGTLSYLHQCHLKIIAEAFSGSETVIEAMLKISRHVCSEMERLSLSFFRDMDRLYEDMRQKYNKDEEERREKMLKVFNTGVEQGVFRADCDYRIMIRMMDLQMEGLKRMEELFPSHITLVEVYRSFTLTFLRGIATPRGLEILDRITFAND